MARPSHVLLEHRARRRDQEARSQGEWDDHVHDNRKQDLYNCKQAEWTSPRCYNRSMSSYNHEKLTEEKLKNLEKRRVRLRAVLQETQEQLNAELTARTDIFQRLERQRLHEHWKRKYPELQKPADDGCQLWQVQMQEAIALEDERRKEFEDEAKQRECVERMKEEEERLKTEEWTRAEKVRKQMEGLKREADGLKKREEALLSQQWEMEDMEVDRRKVAEGGRKAEMGNFLGGQYHAQQKSRTQQVREELEADRRVVGTLLEWEREDALMVDGAQREKAVADATWMQRVVGDQLRSQEEALPAIQYREQAQHAWEKQEDTFGKDRQTRDRLMRELLVGRKQWLKVKLEHNLKAQGEALRRQEELKRQLERDNQSDYSDFLAAAETAREAERRQTEGQRHREMDKKDRETERQGAEKQSDKEMQTKREVPIEKCVTCVDHKHTTQQPKKSALERPVWFFGM